MAASKTKIINDFFILLYFEKSAAKCNHLKYLFFFVNLLKKNMQAIQAQGLVNEKHQLLVQLPDQTKAGNYEVIVLLLKPEIKAKKHHSITFSNHQLPVEGMTFSRSEIYGDDGR